MTEKKLTKPPHEPTAELCAQVEALATYGIPQEEIANYLDIDAKTLRKYYREQLDKSAMKANANVGRFLYRAASGAALEKGATHGDCIRAAMFWAKTRMGWRETGEPVDTSEPTPVHVIVSVVDASVDKSKA